MAEDDYPLLVFPEPTYGKRSQPGGFTRYTVPEASQQGKRLAPEFTRLQDALNRRAIALQDSPLGIQPEQVLVLEVIGTIQNFAKAIEKVEGLESLGVHGLEDISPDHGFANETNPNKDLKGQLFLVMTDQRALQELKNLFDSWKENPNLPFRRGLAPLKEAFKHLKTIRQWDVEDRFHSTGILEDWKQRLAHDQSEVPFEAEFWFRNSQNRRNQAEYHLNHIITSMDGKIIRKCTIPEISYHAVIGQLHREQIQALIENQELSHSIELLRCEEIMHMFPVGQCATRPSDDNITFPTHKETYSKFPQRDPIIALLDGMPLTRHELLDDRLIVDDPDDYESDYPASERRHGTAMASLICRGDIEENSKPLEHRLYVRPIMKPQYNSSSYSGEVIPEVIPADVLPVDIVHRAVRRLYESVDGEPAAAPTIRVINLSLADPARPLNRVMSPWARLLDWLSWKYDVLFLVSAGNYSHDICLEVKRKKLQSLSATNLQYKVLEALANDTRNRHLLSPSETLNGITVAAIHDDSSTVKYTRLIDPFSKASLANVVNAHGPGYRRAIKPDILLPGGRQFLAEKPGTTHTKAVLTCPSYYNPPGQSVASPGLPGQLNRTSYTTGTSNATALASRWASIIYEQISKLREQPDIHLPEAYDIPLVKALLVHSADWKDLIPAYQNALKNPNNSRYFKEYVARFLGYGSVTPSSVLNCSMERATVLGFGKLNDGQSAEFGFPLPPSLSDATRRWRLIITLAWLTPVNSRHQKYRIAHLWFEKKKQLDSYADPAPKRAYANHNAVRRGTVQHEIFRGRNAVGFQDGDAITIKVNCRKDAGEIPSSIRFGLVATLELADNQLIRLPIYQEVRDRLSVLIPVTVT